MKIKATITINMGLYQDIRPEIEIEVPDGLQGKALAEWLHTEFKGLYERKEQRDREKPMNAKSRKVELKDKHFEPRDFDDEENVKGEKIVNINEE